MLKIWSMKQKQQREDQENNDGRTTRKVTPAQLRAQKDLSEVAPSTTIKTEFDNPDDILNFRLILTPDEGMYENGRFIFTFAINQNFPHDPPKVKCTQRIYHPNIDYEGNVCLNILRGDWKPVLNLNAIFFGLLGLFLAPNANDYLYQEAADELRLDERKFQRNVKSAMAGGSVRGRPYDNVLSHP